MLIDSDNDGIIDEEKDEKKEDEENRYFYNIPWNLSANYSLTYNIQVLVLKALFRKRK